MPGGERAIAQMGANHDVCLVGGNVVEEMGSVGPNGVILNLMAELSCWGGRPTEAADWYYLFIAMKG